MYSLQIKEINIIFAHNIIRYMHIYMCYLIVLLGYEIILL